MLSMETQNNKEKLMKWINLFFLDLGFNDSYFLPVLIIKKKD